MLSPVAIRIAILSGLICEAIDVACRLHIDGDGVGKSRRGGIVLSMPEGICIAVKDVLGLIPRLGAIGRGRPPRPVAHCLGKWSGGLGGGNVVYGHAVDLGGPFSRPVPVVVPSVDGEGKGKNDQGPSWELLKEQHDCMDVNDGIREEKELSGCLAVWRSLYRERLIIIEN